MFELNAPARPRSPATSSRPTDRVSLLVEVVAEVLGEPPDDLVDLLLGLVAPVTLGDLLQQLGLVPADEIGQVPEEPLDPADRDPVEVPVGRRVDLDDLVLDRE